MSMRKLLATQAARRVVTGEPTQTSTDPFEAAVRAVSQQTLIPQKAVKRYYAYGDQSGLHDGKEARALNELAAQYGLQKTGRGFTCVAR